MSNSFLFCILPQFPSFLPSHPAFSQSESSPSSSFLCFTPLPSPFVPPSFFPQSGPAHNPLLHFILLLFPYHLSYPYPSPHSSFIILSCTFSFSPCFPSYTIVHILSPSSDHFATLSLSFCSSFLPLLSTSLPFYLSFCSPSFHFLFPSAHLPLSSLILNIFLLIPPSF